LDSPTTALLEILNNLVGNPNRGEYITASSGRKRLLASLFSSAQFHFGVRCELFSG
jgi:hypothetical protein